MKNCIFVKLSQAVFESVNDLQWDSLLNSRPSLRPHLIKWLSYFQLHIHQLIAKNYLICLFFIFWIIWKYDLKNIRSIRSYSHIFELFSEIIVAAYTIKLIHNIGSTFIFQSWIRFWFNENLTSLNILHSYGWFTLNDSFIILSYKSFLLPHIFCRRLLQIY